MAEKSLGEILRKRRQITITVIGRRSGREISLPVWFVADDKALWLLPVHGSETQWYRNLEKTRAITIHVGKELYDLQARLLKEPAAVRDVIERFRDKYTAGEVERWYTGLDAAVHVPFATGAAK